MQKSRIIYSTRPEFQEGLKEVSKGLKPVPVTSKIQLFGRAYALAEKFSAFDEKKEYRAD